MEIFRKLIKIYDKLLNACVFLAGVILIFLVIIVSSDALAKYFFNYPIIWVTQISEYSLLFITFLGAAWLLREEGHVTVEIVIDKLNPKIRSLVQGCTSLIAAFTFVCITIYGTLIVIDFFARDIYDPTLLEIPKAPIIAIIPFGSFLLVIQLIRRAYKGFSNYAE